MLWACWVEGIVMADLCIYEDYQMNIGHLHLLKDWCYFSFSTLNQETTVKTKSYYSEPLVFTEKIFCECDLFSALYLNLWPWIPHLQQETFWTSFKMSFKNSMIPKEEEEPRGCDYKCLYYWLILYLEANCGCSASQSNLSAAWISHLGVICYHLQSLLQWNRSSKKIGAFFM